MAAPKPLAALATFGRRIVVRCSACAHRSLLPRNILRRAIREGARAGSVAPKRCSRCGTQRRFQVYGEPGRHFVATCRRCGHEGRVGPWGGSVPELRAKIRCDVCGSSHAAFSSAETRRKVPA